jgi:hypothetical protein
MLIGSTHWSSYPMVYTRSSCTMGEAHAALLNGGQCVKMKEPLVGWDDCEEWGVLQNVVIEGGAVPSYPPPPHTHTTTTTTMHFLPVVARWCVPGIRRRKQCVCC